jgi:hypothetical protein
LSLPFIILGDSRVVRVVAFVATVKGTTVEDTTVKGITGTVEDTTVTVEEKL